MKALKLPDYIVKTALYNHRTSVNEAAYDLLSTWMKQHENREVAYTRILVGLERCGMDELAAQLKLWVEGSSVEEQTLKSHEESKFYFVKNAKMVMVTKFKMLKGIFLV